MKQKAKAIGNSNISPSSARSPDLIYAIQGDFDMAWRRHVMLSDMISSSQTKETR
jgi:hypothetical protein